MKTFLGLCALVFVMAGSVVAAEQPIFYPTKENPSFAIIAPDDWELSPAEEVDGYFDLHGPTGAVFSFRTIDGDEDSLKAAIEEVIEYVGQDYKDVELGEAQDWTPNGLEGFYSVNSAVDKSDDTPVTIGMGWVVLGNGKIAEMWFVAEQTDKEGKAQAEKIANSLAAP